MVDQLDQSPHYPEEIIRPGGVSPPFLVLSGIMWHKHAHDFGVATYDDDGATGATA